MFGSPNNLNSSFTIDENNPNILKGTCFLEGLVFSNHPINSKINKNCELLYSDYRLEKVYSYDIRNLLERNNAFLKTREIRKPNKLLEAAPYFHIYEKELGEKLRENKINTDHDANNAYRCKIEKNLAVNADHAINFFDYRINRSKITLFDKFIMTIFYFLEKIFFKSNFFKVVGLSYIEKEFGIKNGMEPFWGFMEK